jgi:2-polyprenyl-3-methyl-5-hydroxy-6-metoxy-1,4-benzoquinol methylase
MFERNLERLKDLGDAKRWGYLFRSLRGWTQRDRRCCPYCGADGHAVVKRSHLVTALVRCTSCELLFRKPTDSVEFNEGYYQDAYDCLYVTDLPTPEGLQTFLSTGFAASSMDFSQRIGVLKALGIRPGARLLDFGASWGYASWQFGKAGYDTVGYEVARPRAAYAREKLHVRVEDDSAKLDGQFDVFFSSHVIEHLPTPRLAFDLAEQKLKKGGLFVAITPNGSIDFLRANAAEYHRGWSAIHPLYLDDRFYRRRFHDRPKLLCSTTYGSPYEATGLSRWNRRDDLTLDLSESELLLVTVF